MCDDKQRHVIIVAPHFVPSNLASVHRSRLFANHLSKFGWRPTIVTVHHDYYEEPLDWNLEAMLSPTLCIERVGAIPTRPIRLIGDIGVRGFVPMVRRILQIIDREPVDFLYITVPSFFAAPIGRVVHLLRGTPYGIDYIDPWVHVWPGSERRLTKHWWSRKLGEALEPFSVRDASLITGVADGYFAGMLERNPIVKKHAVKASMPYGGDEADHQRVKELKVSPYLFSADDGRFHLVYAGAMLPRAYEPLRRVFESIASNRELFEDTCLHFIGTGRSPGDVGGYNIRPLAEEFGIWGKVVHEHPARIPYMDVLVHLSAASAAFIIGSTEPHYTPSKVYQAILSEKPILGVLHRESTACSVIQGTHSGQVLAFDAASVASIAQNFAASFKEFRLFAESFDAKAVDRDRFSEYSAERVTSQLAEALNRSLESSTRVGRPLQRGPQSAPQDRAHAT
jgi:hypothetical protein